MVFSIQDHFPVYSVFLLILIICGSTLAELLSCRIRKLIESNIWINHLIAFSTLVFFVVLTIPVREKHIFQIIPKSLVLYAFFLGLIKTAFPYFISILSIIGVIYVLVLRKSELLDENDRYNTMKDDISMGQNAENPSQIQIIDKVQSNNLYVDRVTMINNSLFVCIIPLYFMGIYVYFNSKMKKYKESFSYTTYILGKVKCNK